MQVVLPLCVHLGPPRSRHKDRIKYAIHLLGEMPIGENGEGDNRDREPSGSHQV